ncbi:MAG: 3'(2'),5'-bisphosphate nucleotidase CysQ [Proteobacteria bacterium]|nr:3'(2'),5'-bisphosphate nucleotidase CysQ [Pseudomonadota bacterium]
MEDKKALISHLVDLVNRAGETILEIYHSDFEVVEKADESPLTQADLAAHRLIVAGLARLTPDIPVVSEESVQPPFEERSLWPRYWLVDPLDGTKEFVNKNGEFTVNIALIDNAQPVLGVVGVPVQGLVYSGDVAAGECLKHSSDAIEKLAGRKMTDGQSVTVVASRSHGGERLETYLDDVAAGFGTVTRIPVGSSLKLCILAEGRADLYPRLGPTSEWDIAAAHAVLHAAGGGVWNINGEPLAYNKENVLNPEFIAVADRRFPWRDKLPGVPPIE